MGKDKFNNIPKQKRKVVFNKAWSHINSIKVIDTIEEELKCFYGIFTILSKELHYLQIDNEKKKLLTEKLD